MLSTHKFPASHRWFIAVGLVAILSCDQTPLFADSQQKMDLGAITSVTVFPGVANVERTVALPQGEKGPRRLLLGPLPTAVRDRSIKVATTSDIEVLSVQVKRSSGDPVEPKRVADLRKRVEEAQQALQALVRKDVTLQALQQRYEGLVPGKPGPETNRALTLQAWQGMVDLIMKGIDVASSQRLELVPQLRSARELLDQLTRELAEATAGSERSIATIEVKVFDQLGVGGVFRILYQVPGATWSPAYEVEVESGNKNLDLRSYADVRQWTGEDWPAVPISFSTSLPESGAEPGTLAALKIERPRYLPPEPVMSPRVALQRKAKSDFDRGLPAKAENPREVLSRGRNRIQPKVWEGIAAGDSTGLYFAYEDKRIAPIEDRGFLSVFEAIHAEAVPSGGSARLLYALNRSPYNSDHRCLPELEEAIFRRIKMPLEGDDPLLAGPVAVFSDGDYLGLALIDRTVAPGEDLTIDLGILDQVVVTRTTEDSEEARGLLSRSLQYRTDTRLRFENFGTTAESFEVLERIPISADESVSIRVDRGLTDPDPEELDPADGILRWRISVDPGQSKELRLVWTMQIPKDKILQRREAPERKGEK
ncbi:MAG: hypothetical protein CBC13_07890 [Planctomycetia bacterium TMED53]|nr:MAG: hypothetical protein CBC13_07890 [Planctomycetia bacterium TMED53]